MIPREIVNWIFALGCMAALVAAGVSWTMQLLLPAPHEAALEYVAETWGWPRECCYMRKNGVVCENDWPLAERTSDDRLGRTCREAQR